MLASPLQTGMELHNRGTIVRLFVIISGVGYLFWGEPIHAIGANVEA